MLVLVFHVVTKSCCGKMITKVSRTFLRVAVMTMAFSTCYADCLVGDIMYQEGDSVGFIGWECLNSTHFDGTESFCRNGVVESDPVVFSCSNDNMAPPLFCVQCGPRNRGAALCLYTNTVPDYCPPMTTTTTPTTTPTTATPTASPTTTTTTTTTSLNDEDADSSSSSTKAMTDQAMPTVSPTRMPESLATPHGVFVGVWSGIIAMMVAMLLLVGLL